ncbi:TetR/AcrR family transcriptional regulator [Streptomyces sp. DSM 44915]|uniref:TetR/AcrR family transcriptional regulator n=1 Tax=Streptomyces chisholmiae TaxID=3075540 RepID=A0ABU2JIZ9_9ACTN|nr:TetR/AcrR family transcriptional regulator [Streptomyces sp. DSM 44915]MDT0264963.1 TetR/AcrR family transcriptional regulator [Streptomyces sp. DSM 44915]
MTATSPRRSATRERLHRAAVTLFAEQGLSATTVEQIAERAGVAKGTVYYNFSGKTELFEELLRDGVASLTGVLRRAADATPGGALPALEAMVGAGLSFVAGHLDLVRLLVAEQWRTNRAWYPTLLVVRRQLVGVVEEVLADGVKSGELRPDLDIELTSGALVGMVLTGALDWQAFHPERDQDEVRGALAVLLHGRLGAGDAGHGGPPEAREDGR